MNAEWQLRLSKRFAEAAGVPNLSEYKPEHLWTLQGELREKNETLYDGLNPFLCYVTTLEEKRNDIASWKGDMKGYKADVNAAERDAQREYVKLIKFSKDNNIVVDDLFSEKRINSLKFSKGTLVYWTGTDVYVVHGTRFDPKDGRYPNDGFDYLIGNVYRNQDDLISVNEEDLKPH